MAGGKEIRKQFAAGVEAPKASSGAVDGETGRKNDKINNLKQKKQQ